MKSNHASLLKRWRAERRGLAVNHILRHAERKQDILDMVVSHHADPQQDEHLYVEEIQRVLRLSAEDLATYMNALVADGLVEVHDHDHFPRCTPTVRGIAYNGQHQLLREAHEHVDRLWRERWTLRLAVIAIVISLAALVTSIFGGPAIAA